jgi:flavin-dependent dehydrogenase
LKIAILGAGMTGAYLYRLLSTKGLEIDLFDRKPATRCGISPCAWGTSRGFRELVQAAGLDPARYILGRFDYVMMDGLRIKADLLTFDKPALIRDLLQGAEIRHGRPDPLSYDRAIDASGVSRYLLPPIADDLVLSCIQYRIESGTPLANRIKLGGIGYAWCFPLSGREYHIGCGSLLNDPRRILQDLGWTDSDPSAKRLCACGGLIRLSGPHYSGPFFQRVETGEIWGVGEAIGCVAPLAGDGIVPGMKSVQILLAHWDDPSGYEQAVLQEFGWMKKERLVLDRLRKSQTLGLREALVLKRNSKRMGMKVGLKQAAGLLKHLR